jgi:L-threonylcarbamoyladenylate synthase
VNTIIKRINPEKLKVQDLAQAVEFLRSGELVAFPTETVYGLGGDALDVTASQRIYAAKGRPSDNPLIVHIASVDALTILAKEVPETAYRLAKAFWPGPLTMILKKSDIVPYETTGGLDTIAIRMPSHPVAIALIEESKVYIAAPSANVSGRPSPTTAEHVIEDMNGRIAMILDGGSARIGLESTIVDLVSEKPLILRPGYITKRDLEAVLTKIDYDPAVISKEKSDVITAKAPGMKYRHYAPKGELTIFEGSMENVISTIHGLTLEHLAKGHTVGIIATDETSNQFKEGIVKNIGSRKDEEAIAAHLFGILRDFDRLGVSYIFSESFDDNSLSQAIMNRLLKAAGYQVIQCN